ncbi:MAG: Glycosyl transferase group 1 [Parcubacteria group bacterium GW2011_GWF1_39_37]|nr:MAG: Glycosyl transferase group 1 [Parcubacteria group bacterium GW2011_GWF1_39_37]
MAESAKFFDEDTLFLFVGGTEYDKKIFLDKYQGVKNIRVIGNRPYSEVPMYLKSADVLVLPNSGKSDISKLYTSPMKLFEYMASGVPIVASDLPSMREVLNTSNSTLVKSDSPSALSQGIKTVFDNTGSAGILAKQALHDVDIFSWESRIKKILSVIEK